MVVLFFAVSCLNVEKTFVLVIFFIFLSLKQLIILAKRKQVFLFCTRAGASEEPGGGVWHSSCRPHLLA